MKLRIQVIGFHILQRATCIEMFHRLLVVRVWGVCLVWLLVLV